MVNYDFYVDQWKTIKDEMDELVGDDTSWIPSPKGGISIAAELLLDKTKTRRGLCETEFNDAVAAANTTDSAILYRCCQRMASLCQSYSFGPAGVWMGVFCEEVLERFDEAQYWYNKAAQFDEGLGMYRVGLLYLNERVTLPRSTSLRRCFQDAADRGVVEAQEILDEYFA